MVGTGSIYSLSVNLAAQPAPAATSQAATSVFLHPLSIFNAASYGPITNPVAPGEFVTIFGSGLSSEPLSAKSCPCRRPWANKSVTVNGRAAPLDYVSATQINLLIPFATTAKPLPPFK